MSAEISLRQLEERVKLLEEKMEYIWMGFMLFIRNVGDALDAYEKKEAEG